MEQEMKTEDIRGYYRHFKGNYYYVLGVARHSESLEPMVVYQALYGEKALWVRPLAMFFEQVDKSDYQGPRFVRVNPDEDGCCPRR